ncbi:MAG: GNAT family N-acetyltransferase [Patescibacteria group bacterium]
MGIKITVLKRADAPTLRDIRGLLSQVHTDSSESKGTMLELRNLVKDKNIVAVVAKDGVRIVGMALLYIIANVGRRKGHVEEVVVDGGYRGKGIGRNLMKKLIAAARQKKLKNLYLTSRPTRVAANALYKDIGFEKKETNVYCLKV